MCIIVITTRTHACTHALTHAHTHLFYGPLNFVQNYLGESIPEPIWVLLKQETVSGSGINWAIYISATRTRQITMPVAHHSDFYRPDALPATQATASKHVTFNSAFYFLRFIACSLHSCIGVRSDNLTQVFSGLLVGLILST